MRHGPIGAAGLDLVLSGRVGMEAIAPRPRAPRPLDRPVVQKAEA